MDKRFQLYLILFLAAVIVLLLLTRGCVKPEVEYRMSPPDTVTLVKVIRDTVRIEVPKKVYVKDGFPVMRDSTAWLDTSFTVLSAGGVHVDARLSLGYSLKERLFQDVALWFPRFEYPVDTVIVYKQYLDTVIKYKKPSKWRYVEAGLVGAALGLTIYAVAQGL
jgi:hypothetical protein